MFLRLHSVSHITTEFGVPGVGISEGDKLGVFMQELLRVILIDFIIA